MSFVTLDGLYNLSQTGILKNIKMPSSCGCLHNCELAHWHRGVEDEEDTGLFLKIPTYASECQAWALIYSRDSLEASSLSSRGKITCLRKSTGPTLQQDSCIFSAAFWNLYPNVNE